jgi:hypothetical protein
MSGSPVRWRVRFAPAAKAPFEASCWEVEVENESYQEAVVEAGHRLCRSMSGEAANRLWWRLELIEKMSA